MKYIVSGDNHLRSDVPTCRVEDEVAWKAFQYDALCGIVELANTYEADVIIAGDLFDIPRVAPEMVTLFISAMFPLLGSVHIIGGNHSLPWHREANIQQSSLGILKALAGNNTGKFRYYTATEESINGRFEHSYKLNEDVTIIHTLVFPDEESLPFAFEAVTADYLFDKYDTPWIFTGDMHMAFHKESSGRHVVNAGCMTAQTVKEKEYDVGVWLVDTGEKTDVTVKSDKKPVYRIAKWEVSRLPLNHNPDLVSNAHITRRVEHDEALSSLIEIFQKGGVAVSVDFVTNLMEKLCTKSVQQGTRDIVEEIKEGKNG